MSGPRASGRWSSARRPGAAPTLGGAECGRRAVADRRVERRLRVVHDRARDRIVPAVRVVVGDDDRHLSPLRQSLIFSSTSVSQMRW